MKYLENLYKIVENELHTLKITIDEIKNRLTNYHWNSKETEK